MTVEVRVGGERFSGFREGSVQLSMNGVYNSFEFTYFAPPSALHERALYCGDEVEILVAGESVLIGYVDTTDDDDQVDAVRLRVAGRSKTADLADCSAEHMGFTNARLSEIAQKLADPFLVSVFVEGSEGDPFPSYHVQKGETVVDAIMRGAVKRGLALYTLGGDLVLGSIGPKYTDQRLVRGQAPLIRSSRTDSFYNRFSHYVFRGQVRPSELQWGKKAAQLASSVVEDRVVKRYRPFLYQAEATGAGDLQKRAETERNVRAAASERVSATVQGHTTPEGYVWRPNLLVDFESAVLGVQETLLVQTVRIRFGEREPDQVELELVNIDSYDVVKPPSMKRSTGQHRLTARVRTPRKKKQE
jgi:prophage tail gpP-like protein